MTEDEAKTKWCPFVRIGSSFSGLGALNRDVTGRDVEKSNCIASGCMAWRRDEVAMLRHRRTGSVRPVEPGHVYSTSEETHYLAEGDTGHCGLARHPS